MDEVKKINLNQNLKVKELHSICEKIGLKTYGSKLQLKERIKKKKEGKVSSKNNDKASK